MSHIQNDSLSEPMKKALTSLVDRPLPRIQEHDFVTYFLAGFAGELDKVDIGQWLVVAGSPQNEVEVVSGDTVLFKVPSLVGNVSLKPVAGQAHLMGEIISRVQKLNQIHPTEGQRYMDEMLKDRVVNEHNNFEVIRRWNEIFARYNKPLITLPSTDTAPTTDTSASDGKAIFNDIEEL